MTEHRSFTIQLAEKRIRIKPLYDMIREYCKEYIVSDICENTEKAGGSENEDKTVNPFADLIIQTSPEDIAYERKRSREKWIRTDRRQNTRMPIWKLLPYIGRLQNGCRCITRYCFMVL